MFDAYCQQKHLAVFDSNCPSGVGQRYTWCNDIQLHGTGCHQPNGQYYGLHVGAPPAAADRKSLASPRLGTPKAYKKFTAHRGLSTNYRPQHAGTVCCCPNPGPCVRCLFPGPRPVYRSSVSHWFFGLSIIPPQVPSPSVVSPRVPGLSVIPNCATRRGYIEVGFMLIRRPSPG